MKNLKKLTLSLMTAGAILVGCGEKHKTTQIVNEQKGKLDKIEPIFGTINGKTSCVGTTVLIDRDKDGEYDYAQNIFDWPFEYLSETYIRKDAGLKIKDAIYVDSTFFKNMSYNVY
ncbi:MAG: hypothetical protein AABX80_02875 [Nanoarchaeota archaeon]